MHYLLKQTYFDYYMSRLKPRKLRLLCYSTQFLLIILFHLASSINLYILIPAGFAKTFNPIAKLAILKRIPIKEAKSDIKTHLVIT